MRVAAVRGVRVWSAMAMLLLAGCGGGGVGGDKSQGAAKNDSPKLLVIGIYSADRMEEYTKPGYELYARSLVEELVPKAGERLRTMDGRRYRTVWGSSLGGVVSFYTVWQFPDVFAGGVCMSSTFSFKDDLTERVLSEPKPSVGFYLDSGWPGDNYETTLNMAMALISRGFVYGLDLFHFCFPMAEHRESDWGVRLHLPMQLLSGSVARASRSKFRVLKD